MQMSPEDLTQVRNRLRRAQGQLDAVIRAIDSGAECQEMVTQVAACSKAIQRAGFLLVATGMRQCVTTAGGEDELAGLEKTLLSLA